MKIKSNKTKATYIILAIVIISLYLLIKFSTNLTGFAVVQFSEMPITYTINVDSGANNDKYEVQRIKWALEIIENSTDGVIWFEEVKEYESPELIINGLPLEINPEGKIFIEGRAGPIEIIDNQIIKAQVNLYPSLGGIYGGTSETIKEDGLSWRRTVYDYRKTVSWSLNDCKNFPNTEVHEILHALGIGHNYDNSRSIMFPIKHGIQSCKTNEIEKEVISCLKFIYSNGRIKGNCSSLDLYPWSEEPKIDDFKWDSLPVSYSISDCNDRQKWNVQKAEKAIEDYIGYDLYNFNEFGIGKINFRCHDSFDDVLLNRETDFWDTTVYFPSAQPYFNLNEEGNVTDVEILLFAQERNCGGIEVHELLHGLGLRNHYGYWMKHETELCDTMNMILSRKTKDKVIELYGLG